MKFNQKGFTMIELTVVMAGVIVAGWFLMDQQQTSSKMHTRNNVNQSINSVVAMVQASLANRAICSESLKGSRPGGTIQELKNAKINPAFPDVGQEFLPTGTPVVEVGKVLPGDISISEMKIVTTDGLDYLSVRFDTDPKNSKKQFGSKIVAKQFRLQGIKDSAGVYLSCYSEQSNIVESATRQACLSMGATWISTVTPGRCALTNLPACVISPTTCSAGLYSNQTGKYSIQIIIAEAKRRCETSYKFPRPWPGNPDWKHRTCECTGENCSCNNGEWGFPYSNEGTNCSISVPAVKQEVTHFKCCQP